MSIGFSNELKTDAALSQLTPDEVRAVVELLALAVYSDGQYAFLEEMELEHQLMQLPWMANQQALVEECLGEAAKRALDVRGEASFREAIASAATRLPSKEVQRKVYQMVGTLMWADSHLEPGEKATLGWLAQAFLLDEAEAADLLGDARSTTF